ncbi:MAG: ExeA family protein [Acidobacteriota bacterium]
MYQAFFQLKRPPFEISPDPSFLYPTVRHYEGLAALYYGIRARKGFVVLSGEVGTGKTMIVRCLLEKLDKNRVHYAYVFNTRLSPREFLRYLAGDLGVPVKGRDKGELLLRLHEFLIRRHSQGHTTVLIVDEAHLLRRDVLEEIRLLTNLETNREKLLQIALVGQPELDELLDSPKLRQLKQRIALRYQLQPLTWEEIQGYVGWRLKVAGANGKHSIFPRETLQVIHQYSRGYPRLINTICENALITAYAAGTQSVSVGMIEEVCRDLRLAATDPPVPESAPKPNGQPPTPEFALALQELVDAVRSVTQTYLVPQSPEKEN